MKAYISDTAFDLVRGVFYTTSQSDAFWVVCPRCVLAAEIKFGPRGSGHQLKSVSPLTVVGSIVCPRKCGAHYYVTDGEIVMLANAA